MSNVTRLDDHRSPFLTDELTCTWAELNGLQGELRVTEHGGLSVLLFVVRDTGKAFVIGEKVDG